MSFCQRLSECLYRIILLKMKEMRSISPESPTNIATNATAYIFRFANRNSFSSFMSRIKKLETVAMATAKKANLNISAVMLRFLILITSYECTF